MAESATQHVVKPLTRAARASCTIAGARCVACARDRAL
jgi:hypothetical protein